MATPYIPNSAHTLSVGRYEKPFEVLGGHLGFDCFTSPSGSAFLEGTVVDLDSDGRAVIAASGAGFGFAMHTVADLSSANGYRNMNKTTKDRGEAIGVAYGIGMAATKIHEGSGNVGDYAWWNGTTLQFDASGSVPEGVKVIGRLLHADGSNTTEGVNGTAGSTSAASSVKAIILFNFAFDHEDLHV